MFDRNKMCRLVVLLIIGLTGQGTILACTDNQGHAFTFYVKESGKEEGPCREEAALHRPDMSQLAKQVTSLQAQVTSLVEQNEQLLKLALDTTNSANASGSVYIRWGRTVCPDGAELVYEGYAGGSGHLEEGGMSEYLCLPKLPQWSKYENGLQTGARLYGAEYQMEGHNVVLLGLENNNQQSQFQYDVPCSVCHVTGRGSVITFPALMDCPEKWQREYHGYLMAPVSSVSSNKQKHNPVCMDKSPETVPSSGANNNGALFYFVEAKCGSLPCGPYVEGREITCAVCTR